MKKIVFCVVEPPGLVEIDRRFGGTAYVIRAMSRSVSVRPHGLADQKSRRRENLKSHMSISMYLVLTPSGLRECKRNFGGIHCLRLQFTHVGGAIMFVRNFSIFIQI
jgi:hypothetical protein